MWVFSFPKTQYIMKLFNYHYYFVGVGNQIIYKYTLYTVSWIYKRWLEYRLLWHADSYGEAHSCDKAFPLSPWDWQWSTPAISLPFFPQDPEQHKSHQIPREHFSQLCKHGLFWCVCFLMTQYVSVIKGSSEEDSKGERISTHTYTHFELFARTPVRLKKRATQSISLFYSAAMRWHAIVFPRIPPLCILIPARERMGLLKLYMREAVGLWSSLCCERHSADVLSFIQVNLIKYVCILVSKEFKSSSRKEGTCFPEYGSPGMYVLCMSF